MLNQVRNVKNTIIFLALVFVSSSCALSLTNETGYSSNVIQIVSPTSSLMANGGDTISIAWQTAQIEGVDATENLINIFYSIDNGENWLSVASNLEDTGAYSWSSPSLDSNEIMIAIELINGDINRFVKSDYFSIDSSPPSFEAGSFKINNGSTSTGNYNVRIDLRAYDNATNIKEFCLKYNDNSQPSVGHSCWIAVNAPTPGLEPALAIELDDFYTTIGLIGGPYTVYAWAKDEHGKISDLSAGGAGTEGQDRATINFSPSTPPVVIDVLATNTDNPSDPPSFANKTITLGSDVYIKWNASDAEGLSTNPISIEYTTDDVTWTSAATGLTNGQNGSCSVDHPGTTADDSSTGCYQWSSGSPTSAYYKIRVVALDDASMESAASSSAINTSKVNVVAGNVDHGLGFSASSAMFFSNPPSANYGDKHSLVITNTGITIFKDRDRGILYVDPADGLLKTLISYNASNPSNFGDGGAISGATIRNAIAINLDFSDRLLVWDDDRIRRVNLNFSDLQASTIDTIIGGGSNTSDTIASALDLKITPPSTTDLHFLVFQPLPNGKIYFNSSAYRNTNATYRLRLYDSNGTNQITSIIPGGTGASSEPTLDLSLCNVTNLGFTFDTVTSSLTHAIMVAGYHNANGCLSTGVFKFARLDPSTFQSSGTHPSALVNYQAMLSFNKNGRDGNLYLFGPNYGRIHKFDTVSGDFVTVVGNGTTGECSDGTAALSCAIHPFDIWVNSTGRLYFLDRGRIRYVDTSGDVQTIMGQGWSYGDGGSALFARFKEIADFDVRNSGEIILLDADARRFREFSVGGSIATIAGTGEDNIPDTVNPAINEPLNLEQAGSVWDNFAINPVNGEVFFHRHRRTLARLDRASGLWVDVVEDGGTHYSSADGMTGSNIYLGSYPARPIAYNGSDILVMLRNYLAPNAIDSMLKLYDSTSSYTQSHMAGNTGTFSSSFCADGTALASCNVGEPRNNISGHWDSVNSRWLILHENTRNKVRSLVQGANMATLDTLSNNALSFAYYDDTVNEHIYYCNESTGVIHEKIVGGADSALSWPISSMSCKGNKMYYDNGSDELTFIFEQNGMQGIGKYLNP